MPIGGTFLFSEEDGKALLSQIRKKIKNILPKAEFI
jgi:hypothetical protein